ncbi:hypothetical protein BV20DRAFT_144220 [Pilatotrama ljubarskyi]|nr:hypothetical protein BV20DRAFT_144220 [Pilatotrama ljubarskyi]
MAPNMDMQPHMDATPGLRGLASHRHHGHILRTLCSLPFSIYTRVRRQLEGLHFRTRTHRLLRLLSDDIGYREDLSWTSQARTAVYLNPSPSATSRKPFCRSHTVYDMPEPPTLRMDVAKFAHRFFPVPSHVVRPSWPSNLFEQLALVGDLLEIQLFEKVMRIVNTRNLAPAFKLAAAPHQTAIEVQGVDEFPQPQALNAAFYRMAENSNASSLRWVNQLVSVRFIRHDTDKDPFEDRDDAEAPNLCHMKARKHVVAYAEQIFRIQQRTALFMLLVIGRNCRFVRWDRSGVIATPSMDYVSEPGVLCDLIWRMGMQSNQRLGVDPSATRLYPDDEEYKLMDEFTVDHATDLASNERILTDEEVKADNPLVFDYVRRSFCFSLKKEWPRYRLQVPCGGHTRSFLVGRPMFCHNGMAGRGTRGYIALDVERKRFVWLKDAWRTHYEVEDQEGSVLLQLNAKSIRFVPTLVCHGDIQEETTVTPEVWEEQNPQTLEDPPSSASPKDPSPPSSAAPHASPKGHKRTRSEFESEETPAFREDCPFRYHKHYRIVVEEVAMPLDSFQCGRQLVQVLRDCLFGHWQAATIAHFLHRDVSGGNTLILPKLVHDPDTGTTEVVWTGLLVDWELSQPTADNPSPELLRPRKIARIGTWPFMSVAMQSDETKVLDIPDELESFTHVLLYYAIRYLSSNCEDVATYMEWFFDPPADEDSLRGHAKYLAVQVRGYLEVERYVRLRFCSPLDTIFKELLPSFKAHYKVQKWRETQAKRPDPGNKPLSPLWMIDADAVQFLESLARAGKDRVRSKTAKYISSPDMPTPTEELRATDVASHQFMLSLLNEELEEGEWWADKVGDRIPLEYWKQKQAIDKSRDDARSTAVKCRKTMPIPVSRMSRDTGLLGRAFRSLLPCSRSASR